MKKSEISTRWLGLIGAVVGLLASGWVQAAGLLTPSDGRLPPLELTEQHVEVIIEDGYAVTTVEQVFHNPHDHDLEAIYSFPVPEKGAVAYGEEERRERTG